MKPNDNDDETTTSGSLPSTLADQLQSTSTSTSTSTSARNAANPAQTNESPAGLLGLFDPPPSLASASCEASVPPPNVPEANTVSEIASPPRNPTAPQGGNFAVTPNAKNLSKDLTSLSGLFAPPPPPPHLHLHPHSISSLDHNVHQQGETSSLLPPAGRNNSDYYMGFNGTQTKETLVPVVFQHSDRGHDSVSAGGNAFLNAKAFSAKDSGQTDSLPSQSLARRIIPAGSLQPTTFAGAFMFLLYHVVFCLANGSAIIRPHSMEKPILGIMSKITSVGILFSAPFYISRLGADIPALYPSVDLFLAPFLAGAAKTIDESLYQQYQGAYPDCVFFTSFAVLTGIGMFLAGCFLVLAASFKLANLGTYLPYSVLCGFFSAVGVLLWALAFSVDTSGKTWQAVFMSGDKDLIWDSALHHFPSLVIGILMNRLGPKNPFYVILLILATLVTFYACMAATGTSLKAAQQAKWFWSSEELLYESDEPRSTWESWTLPPTPFANIFGLLSIHTNWTAVVSGLQDMAALAFLYLLRSSIHASALKKNIGNLVRRIPQTKPEERADKTAQFSQKHIDSSMDATQMDKSDGTSQTLFDSVRQSVGILNLSLAEKKAKRDKRSSKIDITNGQALTTAGDNEEYIEIRAKSSKRTLEEIFQEYGYCLFLVAGCGGFGCCPTVATSNTMFAIGAEGLAPQYGSVLLLLVFYFTNFEMVQYIPKTAFSSLLVLGAVDTLVIWFIGPFKKSQELAEMAVIPIIVIFSLFVGFLNAVFLGIGISMFVFVASFFRVGVVKFNATALEVRSRIERSMAQSVWLDNHGDYVQILVLQNYLFFGNASSILNYVATMFEDVDEEVESRRLDFALPPMPKIVVLDLSLISGMDTSTVDIFTEIKELCNNNECKLYLCGLSPRVKKGLALGGVKTEVCARSARIVRIFPDLDTALGVAEDFLIETKMEPQDQPSRTSGGFRFALEQIDELHDQQFSSDLQDLEQYVSLIELDAGTYLFQSDGSVVNESERGLFFIESGLLKVERDSRLSLTMTRSRSSHTLNSLNAVHTLKHQHARMGSLARRGALAKSGGHASSQNIRIARVGPGWVVGTLENATGIRQAGATVAASRCRLHHLSFGKLEILEKENPLLILRLYKMLSHLMARKEEIAIINLSTLQTILSSPAHSAPVSRSALKAMMQR